MKSLSLALAAALAIGGLTPAVASAQDYRYAPPSGYGRGYADPCRQARQNQTAGTIVGAIAGAALGSNVASRGARSEGGVVGALAGALVGSQMAKGSDAAYACYGPDGRPIDGYAQQRPYGYGYGAPRPYRERGYGYGRYDDRYDRDARYGRDRDDDRDRDGARAGRADDADGCRLAESDVRLPNGRVEQRWVRVCPDANGDYRIVD